ncbi:LacI family transcriptional regulator, partial [Mycobacterium tuberculosis]
MLDARLLSGPLRGPHRRRALLDARLLSGPLR